MRSDTLAVKAVRALTPAGINALKVGIDPSLTRRGCGFGVSVDCRDIKDAERILQKKHIAYGDILGSHR